MRLSCALMVLGLSACGARWPHEYIPGVHPDETHGAAMGCAVAPGACVTGTEPAPPDAGWPDLDGGAGGPSCDPTADSGVIVNAPSGTQTIVAPTISVRALCGSRLWLYVSLEDSAACNGSELTLAFDADSAAAGAIHVGDVLASPGLLEASVDPAWQARIDRAAGTSTAVYVLASVTFDALGPWSGPDASRLRAVAHFVPTTTPGATIDVRFDAAFPSSLPMCP